MTLSNDMVINVTLSSNATTFDCFSSVCLQIMCASASTAPSALTPMAISAKAHGQLWVCTSDGHVGQVSKTRHSRGASLAGFGQGVELYSERLIRATDCEDRPINLIGPIRSRSNTCTSNRAHAVRELRIASTRCWAALCDMKRLAVNMDLVMGRTC